MKAFLRQYVTCRSRVFGKFVKKTLPLCFGHPSRLQKGKYSRHNVSSDQYVGIASPRRRNGQVRRLSSSLTHAPIDSYDDSGALEVK